MVQLTEETRIGARQHAAGLMFFAERKELHLSAYGARAYWDHIDDDDEALAIIGAHRGLYKTRECPPGEFLKKGAAL
jgi:hypothetical protein